MLHVLSFEGKAIKTRRWSRQGLQRKSTTRWVFLSGGKKMTEGITVRHQAASLTFMFFTVPGSVWSSKSLGLVCTEACNLHKKSTYVKLFIQKRRCVLLHLHANIPSAVRAFPQKPKNFNPSLHFLRDTVRYVYGSQARLVTSDPD